jgi:hypothetical protein
MKRRAMSGVLAALASLGIATTAMSVQTEAESRIERHAEVGQTVRLGGHVNYRRCGVVIPTTISVITVPGHGTLATRDEVVTSAHPNLGDFARCRNFSGLGRVVYYTRTSPGSDKFKYDSLT